MYNLARLNGMEFHLLHVNNYYYNIMDLSIEQPFPEPELGRKGDNRTIRIVTNLELDNARLSLRDTRKYKLFLLNLVNFTLKI